MPADWPVFFVRDGFSAAGGVTVTGRETGGDIGIIEAVIPAGHSVHWHTHTRETECFYVIAGQFRFWCGEEVAEGGPGTTIVAPPHLRHRWHNLSDQTGRLLIWVMPGGFETFFADLDALGTYSPQAIFELETRYGVISEILDTTV